MKRILFTVVLLALASTALAQPALKPWYSLDRLALAGGADYAFHSGEAANLPRFDKEWDGGAFLAFNLLPSLDAKAQTVYGFDNKTWRTSLGLSTPIAGPKSLPMLSISAGLNYAWHAGEVSNLPKFPHEFEAGLFTTYRLVPSVLLAGSSVYGMDNKTFRSSLGLRVVLKPVKGS